MSQESRPFSVCSHSVVVLMAALVCFACRQPTMWTPKAPYGTTTGTKDFDLTSKETDPNGSPLDPLWAPQAQKPQNLPPTPASNCTKSGAQPYQPGCTDQAKTLVRDTGKGINGLLCSLFGDANSINGHEDWTAARAAGPLAWLNFAEDFDYNLLLLPDQEYGLTGNNNEWPEHGGRYMEVEFDSREFDGRFGTSWWQEFARLAEKGAQSDDYSEIQEYMHPGTTVGYGVVYGIFGIDCEHGCRSEIHPAYAVAIQVTDTKDTNKWAIFARNWGDEGFCSHFDHQLDLSNTQNAIHLLLPYHSATGPRIKRDDYEVATWSQDSGQCPTYGFRKDEGEEVTIPLPPPGEQKLTEVVVDFEWPDGASGAEYPKIEKTKVKKLLATRRSQEESQEPGAAPRSVEEQLGQLRREYNQGRTFPEGGFQEGVFKKFIARRSPTKQSAASLKNFESKSVRAGCPVPEAANPPAMAKALAVPARTKLPEMRSYAAKELWDQAAVQDLCVAYQKFGLPKGEPADLKAKLDRICRDKRARP